MVDRPGRESQVPARAASFYHLCGGLLVANKSPISELIFPIGGLNRNAAFQAQPPSTTPYCQNVRPFDVVNLASAQMHGMRQRGGARPGLTKTYAQQISNGPIQMLNFASVLGSDGTSNNILLAIADGTLYQNASGDRKSVV